MSASSSGLTAQSIVTPRQFNWPFLVELLVCGSLALFFLFYFNRVFAKIISVLVRLYLRWTGSPLYIDIQSLQISLLAGRVFFGKVIYHGTNESITVVGGHLTWRYWLRRVRQAAVQVQDGDTDGAGHSQNGKDELPCRILLELEGLEWFVYNRSPAYDSIVEQMASASRENGGPNPPTPTTSHTPDKIVEDSLHGFKQPSRTQTMASRHTRSSKSVRPQEESLEDMIASSPYLRTLPIGLVCARGAVVMGNNNTPSILVAHFQGAKGVIDAAKCRAGDKYKQVINIAFAKPVIQFKANHDFKESMLARGARILRRSSNPIPDANRTSVKHRSTRQKLRDLLPLFAASTESIAPSETETERQPPTRQRSGQDRWMGLQRYLDDPQQEEGWRFEPVEYARVTNVLDCSLLTMSFYWDVPGSIPEYTELGIDADTDATNINGPLQQPPEWGVDLAVDGGTIHYGPWADRQRIHLQNMFAPKLYKSSTPAERLAPGRDRAYTDFKVFIELSSSTTLRIPLREASKDWKYRRRLDEGDSRPYGWLEIKVASESTISYRMGMIAGPNGWSNGLDLELKNPEVRSSVNHGLLWHADVQTLQCDLSGPLQWNGDTKWIFNNTSRGIRFFLLREHVTLLTDLVTDWTDGPGAEYWTFVPMIYELNLRLEDFEFFFNVNDQNIINNPSDFDDNTFLFLRNLQKNQGWLQVAVSMDFREFRPQCSAVQFSIEMASEIPVAGQLELGAKTPIWNTWSTFLTDRNELGRVNNIKVAGSYEFFDRTAPDLIDTLNLEIEGDGLQLTLYGFLIRYFMIVKENYFGENVHFKTLEEWQNQQAGVPQVQPVVKKTNDLDVALSVHASDISIVLPKHVYSPEKHLKLAVPVLGLDMRFTNYYMDLQVDVGPISCFLGTESQDMPQVFVDGLAIYGHRLFGLPPTEPTYVCNWDFSVGSVSCECTTEFLQTLIFSLKSFVFGFSDVENALPAPSAVVIYDVTFLRLNVASIRLWLHMHGSQAFRLTADGISFSLNDLADDRHSDRITVKIPGLTMACMDLNQRHICGGTEAYLGTDIEVTVFGKKKDAMKLRTLQRKHVRESDFRTGRARFLLNDDDSESRDSSLLNDLLGPDQPSMALPSLSPPIYEMAESRYSQLAGSLNFDTSSRMTGSSGRKSSRSFIVKSQSSSAVSQRSLRRAASSHFAPSFHSALESLPDVPAQTPTSSQTQPFPSHLSTPVPTTPGSRRSSKRRVTSPRGRGLSFGAGPRSVNVRLHSSFAKPNFPLDLIEPDLTKVPELSEDLDHHVGQRGASGSYEMFTGEDAQRDSILIEFKSGIKGYCTPAAIIEVAHLLEDIQVKTPDDILDYVQIDVVAKIEKAIKNIVSSSSVLEACIRIPVFSFTFFNSISTSVSKQHEGCKAGSDTFNLQLRSLLAAGRSKTIVDDSADKDTLDASSKQILSFHLLLDSFRFGLHNVEPSLARTRPVCAPALGALMEDVLLWVSTGDHSTASLRVKRFITSIESKQAVFLSDAARRTAALAEQLGKHFSAVTEAEKKRIQQLVFLLATQGEESRITNDPAALTRPSYVLRSAQTHVRLNDSWKINSRLRHVWQCLTPTARIEWTRRSVEGRGMLPADAKARVIGVLDRWRGWEMSSIEESALIKDVFGSEKAPAGKRSKDHPVNAGLTVELIQILIDPGPTQDEFVVDDLSTSISIMRPQAANGGNAMAIAAPGAAASTVVQLHSKNIKLGIKWEVLEAVETVLAVLASQPKHEAPRRSSIKSDASPRLPAKGPMNVPGGVHVVLTADTSTISLDTVNLKILSMAKNLKSSLILSESNVQPQEGHTANVASLLMQADLAMSEICYGNKVLSKTIIRAPSVYGYADGHWVAATRFHTWKVASSCEDLSFDVREQVLGLMEVVDFVVNDEVSQIRKLVDRVKDVRPGGSHPQSRVQTVRNVHMVYISLSLEQFSLGATLLPSLAYLFRGGGVRLWARPNPRDSKETVIDFDVLHHEHEVCTGTGLSETRSISILELPAINGSVKFRDGEQEKLLEMHVSVEEIQLDASAIQSLMNALNKPEVVKVVESAQAEWTGTQTKLDEIFGSDEVGPPTPVSSEPAGTPFVYRAHGSVLGVKIQTSAPSANLEINLGTIQLQASNRPRPNSPLLTLPEIRLDLQKITVELTRKTIGKMRCGYLELHASLIMTSSTNAEGATIPEFAITSHSLKVDLFAETASTVVDVAGHLQDKLRDLDLSKEVKYLRKLRNSKSILKDYPAPNRRNSDPQIFNTTVSMELLGIQISWIVGGSLSPSPEARQNLVLSVKRIAFATATRKDNEAQLIIEQFLLQMVNPGYELVGRSENSALMPEVVFNVAHRVTGGERRLAFQAKGTSLDLRLTTSCVVGANAIETSIASASQRFRAASASWKSTPTQSGAARQSMFGAKRLVSVLVDADFAGAVVHIAGPGSVSKVVSHQARYSQFSHGEATGYTTLRSPGIAFKAEYIDPKDADPSLSAEIKISASSNILYPTVVPLVLEITNSVKDIVRQPSEDAEANKGSDKASEKSSEKLKKELIVDETKAPASNAAAILGKCRLNIGLRVCKQEFTLSCQPIARVAASGRYEEIYLTINTCDEAESGRFYAVSATITGMRTSLQHVYSRESTGHLAVDSVVLSLMNSKHVMGSQGLSCILKLSPVKSHINVKQFQDFLLFREIWYPKELRSSDAVQEPVVHGAGEPPAQLVQRYHKVTATKAFPWNTTMIVSEIDLQLDLGQSLGKTALLIANFWVTSRKTSSWEQIMCLGFDTIRVSSAGRLSGFIDLQGMKVRTSINWSSAVENDAAVVHAPLIEASIGFKKLQIKLSFDYQAFLIADITRFDFLMYNVQDPNNRRAGDRLVGTLDGEKVQVFCTTMSASQGLALWQAFQRLVREKMDAYDVSIREVERFMHRRSQAHLLLQTSGEVADTKSLKEVPPPVTASLLSLHTDVVIKLKEVNIGAFPSTFHDTQVFKLEALDATSRFAVEVENGKIHSMLQMTLGQLRIALGSVKRVDAGGTLADVSVEDVITQVTGSRGGTILKVPQVTAFMHTWHKPRSMVIDYIFKSAFEGQVDVGWNFSRVSFIKGMYQNHVKALAQRQGKAPASSRISMYTDASAPQSQASSEAGAARPGSASTEEDGVKPKDRADGHNEKEHGKITAVVDMPQSKYEYNALEPPVIETPQLRDMGEATPPLEWIGLHRDRLPNLTHQIVIVTLLEIAREVGDAYSKILGSS